MRVTSEFYVAALTRRVFGAGDFAAVLKKGATEAGAIFIRQRQRSGLETLYGPAPQSMVPEDGRDDRLFEIRQTDSDPQAIEALLAREQRFDGDLWIVELDCETVEGLFPITTDESSDR